MLFPESCQVVRKACFQLLQQSQELWRAAVSKPLGHRHHSHPLQSVPTLGTSCYYHEGSHRGQWTRDEEPVPRVMQAPHPS